MNDSIQTFTREDLADLLAANERIIAFKEFVITRFGEYTRHEVVLDDRGRSVTPIKDPHERTNAGYGLWRVADNWLRVVATKDDPEILGGKYVPVEHFLADDRGPGSVTSTVKVPLSFIFGDVQREEERAEYLRLKAIFEPDADGGAVVSAPAGEVPVAPEAARDALEADEPDEPSASARIDAARFLLNQCPQYRGGPNERDVEAARLANPANRDDAADVYAEVMKSLLAPGKAGTKDLRRKAHEAADILGITHASAEPTDGKSAEDTADTEATRLGVSLLDAMVDRLSGLKGESPLTAANAGKMYEKVRAALTLTGEDVFGDHTEQVLSVADDVAELIGIKKKRR